MDDHKVEYWLGWFLVILCAAAFGVMIALGACASQPLLTRLDTAQKLAQCVEPVVLAELAAREAAAAEAVAKSHADAGVQTPHEAVDSIARDARAM